MHLLCPSKKLGLIAPLIVIISQMRVLYEVLHVKYCMIIIYLLLKVFLFQNDRIYNLLGWADVKKHTAPLKR